MSRLWNAVLLWSCVCLGFLSVAQGADDDAAMKIDHSSHKQSQMDQAADDQRDSKCGGPKCGMPMAFYWGHKNVEILFPGVVVNTPGEMVGACFVLFISAILYEALKYAREYLKQRNQGNGGYNTMKVPGGDGTVIMEEKCDKKARPTMCSLHHYLQTILQIIQVGASYLLMLVTMTYNGYLFIAVCVGSGAGYFLFSLKKEKVVDITEHCH